jgi:hypothetical protein
MLARVYIPDYVVDNHKNHIDFGYGDGGVFLKVKNVRTWPIYTQPDINFSGKWDGINILFGEDTDKEFEIAIDAKGAKYLIKQLENALKKL